MKAGRTIAAFTATSVIAFGGLTLGIVLGDEDDGADVTCARGAGVAIEADLAGLPTTIGAFDAEQVRNAAYIINAGKALEVSAHGQQIAVMTAIGESTLRILDYGDGPGPDSRGLFQQRDNGAWGSYSDRMDPTISATNFYKKLLTIPGWETLQPTLAANRVQRNADPFHYAESWEKAGQIMVGLSGFDLAAVSGPGGGCGGGALGGAVSASGWAHPIPGLRKYQNNYNQPRLGYLHAGEDLSAPLGTPLYAAADGVITRTSCEPWKGRSPCQIVLDVGTTDAGQRVEIVYVHMFPNGIQTTTGARVTAGQQIATTGNNGRSSGPHLHLEVWLDGVDTDPTDFFHDRGIDITKGADGPVIVPAAASSGGGQQALAWAQTQIGRPYLLGATGPNSYDCSGLTLRAWEQAGKTLPRVSADQWGATTRITREQLQPGDLVFWSDNGRPDGIYHVALYAGDGKVTQAPSPGKTVETVNLYTTNLLGFGRVT